MQTLDAAQVAAASPYPALIEALRTRLDARIATPERGHYDPSGRGDTLLTMPAWRTGGLTGVKLVTVYPRNRERDLPSLAAVYVAFDGGDGRALAVLDGTELTKRRTAAVSALAASFLARPDGRRMLVIGTGALAPELARAHASERSLERIAVWGRDPQKAARLAESLRGEGLPAESVTDLASATGAADIVAAATTATEPILRREWIRPGTHLSLVGAFTKAMAEADVATVAAARIFADTRAGVLAKGGEVAQAIERGLVAATAIEDDLFGLVAKGRLVARAPGDITLFKSVGSSAFDLVAAELVLQASIDPRPR